MSARSLLAHEVALDDLGHGLRSDVRMNQRILALQLVQLRHQRLQLGHGRFARDLVERVRTSVSAAVRSATGSLRSVAVRAALDDLVRLGILVPPTAETPVSLTR